jgi:hypothetical protein
MSSQLTVTPVSFGLHLYTQMDTQCSVKALKTVYSLILSTPMTNVIPHSFFS